MATGIKLVAIDGLRALIDEYRDPAYPVTVALLNAYTHDLYYAIQDHDTVTTGIFYGTEPLIEAIQKLPDRTVRFIGNGVPIHANLLHAICGERMYVPEPNPETCSLQIVVQKGFQQWVSQQDIVEQVMPLYLKSY
jgi:tRNA A37 threonylcarbamoyladenosine modification protein TsaB